MYISQILLIQLDFTKYLTHTITHLTFVKNS